MANIDDIVLDSQQKDCHNVEMSKVIHRTKYLHLNILYELVILNILG